MTTDTKNLKIRGGLWALGAILGLLQAWFSRMDIVNDTVSYLDMGNYFFHGHHGSIINGLWAPFYAWLLGFMIYVVNPSAYWEYPAVHLLLFFVFLFNIACFDYFFRQVAPNWIRSREDEKGSIPPWVWITIAYTIFLWASLSLIGVWETNPDMLVSAFFYLLCGLLIKISNGRATWWTFLAFGLVLGLSYLTKFVMLPVAFMFLAAAWITSRRSVRYVFISTIVFVVIAASFITALSMKKSRFTMGESGPYNYEVHVNHIPFSHWQGDAASGVALLHPTHQIYREPATFEFAQTLGGTYPVWYDPSVWYEGLKPRFSVCVESAVLVKGVIDETGLLAALGGVPFAAVFLLFYSSGRKWLVLKDISKYWFLVLLSLGALGLYALVHYETRYVSPFFVVLMIALLASVTIEDGLPNQKLFAGVAVLQLLVFLSPFGWPDGLYNLKAFYKTQHANQIEHSSYQDVASAALRLGLTPGDHIASLDYALMGTSMWAHLDRLQVTAEVYYWPQHSETWDNNFWNTDPSTEARVLDALAQSGARAAVSHDKPRGPLAERWVEIGTTGYYLYWLDERRAPAQRRQ